MYYGGIDIGSVSTDVVIINQLGEMVGHEVVPTGANFRAAADKGIETALQRAKLTREDVAYIVCTGYGRKSLDMDNGSLTEIKCHGTGAHHLSPEIRTIIDIGGQDCKVISLNADGSVADFVMNDKCSAGTGRFVDVMAKALQVELEEMGALSLASTENCRISNICTVFAESEVISKLSANVPKEDIIKGIHSSIGERVYNLVQRVELKKPVGITGGGGKNIGIIRVLEELLGTELITYQDPQIVGALGAALEARKQRSPGQQAAAQ